MRDFNHSVNVLVKAYLNDTLEHTTCAACAVGNLIADSLGYTIKQYILNPDKSWKAWFSGETFTDRHWLKALYYECNRGESLKPYDYDEGVKQLSATGYSIIELNQIEQAFERAKIGASPDEFMFNGLMAVVDVLADIHGVDLSVKESAKLMFVKS